MSLFPQLSQRPFALVYTSVLTLAEIGFLLSVPLVNGIPLFGICSFLCFLFSFSAQVFCNKIILKNIFLESEAYWLVASHYLTCITQSLLTIVNLGVGDSGEKFFLFHLKLFPPLLRSPIFTSSCKCL